MMGGCGCGCGRLWWLWIRARRSVGYARIRPYGHLFRAVTPYRLGPAGV